MEKHRYDYKYDDGSKKTFIPTVYKQKFVGYVNKKHTYTPHVGLAIVDLISETDENDVTTVVSVYQKDHDDDNSEIFLTHGELEEYINMLTTMKNLLLVTGL